MFRLSDLYQRQDMLLVAGRMPRPNPGSKALQQIVQELMLPGIELDPRTSQLTINLQPQGAICPLESPDRRRLLQRYGSSVSVVTIILGGVPFVYGAFSCLDGGHSTQDGDSWLPPTERVARLLSLIHTLYRSRVRVVSSALITLNGVTISCQPLRS